MTVYIIFNMMELTFIFNFMFGIMWYCSDVSFDLGN